MRYPASEKLEIIRTVEQSHLPAKRTLDQLGIARRCDPPHGHGRRPGDGIATARWPPRACTNRAHRAGLIGGRANAGTGHPGRRRWPAAPTAAGRGRGMRSRRTATTQSTSGRRSPNGANA